MKKLFISQPMNGKTDEEILRERNEAINIANGIDRIIKKCKMARTIFASIAGV